MIKGEKTVNKNEYFDNISREQELMDIINSLKEELLGLYRVLHSKESGEKKSCSGSCKIYSECHGSSKSKCCSSSDIMKKFNEVI